MNEEDYQEYLEECYIYAIIRVNSNSDDVQTHVEGIYRDKKIANKLLWALREEHKGAFEVSFHMSRTLF